MDFALLLLVTFVGATVQSATGFGFGLIAVSAFLIVLNSVAAIQVVIIITLIMSCIHWPKLRHFASPVVLRRLIVGSALGFPVGIFIYNRIDLATVKTVVALLLLLITSHSIWQMLTRSQGRFGVTGGGPPKGASFGVGIASGMMASCLAMPGPPVMLFLARCNLDKDEIRATILTLFVFSYAGALVLQAGLVGIEIETWQTALLLTPAAPVGVVAGHYLSRHINPEVFRVLVVLILLSTGLFMLTNG